MNKLLVIMVLLIFSIASCKDDSNKKSNGSIDAPNAETEKFAFNERTIEDALYEGYFVKNTSGFDVTIMNNTMFMLKSNPSEKDKNTNFFIDIVPQQGKLQNFDLPTNQITFNDSLSENYNNVAVYKFQLPKEEGAYEIIVGQYDNSGRIWTSSIKSNMLNQNNSSYKNEYSKNTKSKKYLTEFESALDEGYFMMYPEGYDMLVNKNIIYFIKPTNKGVDVETRFYLHIKFENSEEQMILDFSGREFQVDHMLGPKYENFTVVRKEIISDKKMVEIGAGQFNNEGRPWQVIYDLEKMYDNISYIYDNQYKVFIETN